MYHCTPLLAQLAVSRGCSVRHWEPEADGHTFDLAALEALVTPSTSLVVVNFPHNPTGATLTAEQLQRLAQICHAANAMLFSDEMYLFLPHDPAQQLPTAALLSPQAVCLSGMSKCFGMPGIRLGWLVSQDVAFIRAAAQLKDYSTICTAGPSEWLALQGLRNAAAVVDAERRIVLRNLQLLEDFFNRCAAAHNTLVFIFVFLLFFSSDMRPTHVCMPTVRAPQWGCRCHDPYICMLAHICKTTTTTTIGGRVCLSGNPQSMAPSRSRG